jgi:ADP-ribose pyrophosphatase YjhB (NUDIX family)
MTHIRPIVIGLAIRDGAVLAAEGYDDVKGERFYRPPGGEIEFGESSEEALRREWREELDMDLASARFLGVLENRFEFNGEPGHEVVFAYLVELSADDGLRDEIVLREGDLEVRATWLPLAAVRDGSERLYPEGLVDLIDSTGPLSLVR